MSIGHVRLADKGPDSDTLLNLQEKPACLAVCALKCAVVSVN